MKNYFYFIGSKTYRLRFCASSTLLKKKRYLLFVTLESYFTGHLWVVFIIRGFWRSYATTLLLMVKIGKCHHKHIMASNPVTSEAFCVPWCNEDGCALRPRSNTIQTNERNKQVIKQTQQKASIYKSTITFLYYICRCAVGYQFDRFCMERIKTLKKLLCVALARVTITNEKERQNCKRFTSLTKEKNGPRMQGKFICSYVIIHVTRKISAFITVESCNKWGACIQLCCNLYHLYFHPAGYFSLVGQL